MPSSIPIPARRMGSTILFFVALFIVVGGMVETGVINSLAQLVITTTKGHPVMTMLVLLWASLL